MSDEPMVIDLSPLANNRRTAPERLDEPLEDIDLVEADDTDDDGEIAAELEAQVWGVSPLRGPVERFANRPLPTWAGTRDATRWWARHLGLACVQILVHFPEIIWGQVRHTARGIGMWCGVYAHWRAKPHWMEAARVAEEKNRSKEVGRVENAKRHSTNLTWLAFMLAVVFVAWCAYTDRTWLILAATAALAGALNLYGRTDAPAGPGIEIMPTSSFQAGAPSSMVVADVRAVLESCGHDPAALAVVEPRVAQHGMVMRVHSPREIGEGEVTAIERGLQTYRGAVSLIGEPHNAALTELRIMWEDPLAASCAPLRLPPNSQTIATPAVLGYGLGGLPLELNLMRVNVGIVGSPGSGKSSTLWAIIDWLSCCRDVVLHGIDLSGGPMITSWGGVFESRAFNKDDAVRLLRERIASAISRTHVLAARSEPVVGGPPPGSENWEPSDGKFHILIIDELPLLAGDPDLCALLAEHQRIGRKAGETSIWASQDLAGTTIGATSIRKYPSTIIMHACSIEDVTTALGGGKVKQGWAPHRLVAAEGDIPNDAGKCFIKSGRHNRPVPWRMARLDDVADIHSRALERMAAGRPTDDEDVAGDAHVVANELVEVIRAFAAHGDPPFLPTEIILGELNSGRDPDAARTDSDLAAALKPHGVEPDRARHGGRPRRGYKLAAINAAAEHPAVRV